MIDLLVLLCLVSTVQINELSTAGVEITCTFDEADRGAIDVPGALYLSPEGAPDVPSLQYMIGIPQRGNVRVQIIEQRARSISDTVIAPAVYGALYEHPIPVNNHDPGPAYSENEYFPYELVTVSDPGLLRDIRIVMLTINPVQYNPMLREVRFTFYVRVRIVFTEPPVDRPNADRLFENIYEHTIINYRQCKNWRRTSIPDRGTRHFETGQWYRFEVKEEGLYRIGYDELIGAGIDPAQFDPRTMKIYTSAFDLLPRSVDYVFPDSMVEVPVYVSGEDDRIFNRNDYLVFYGFSADHVIPGDTIGWFENGYTRMNVYWFTFGGMDGKRMAVIDAAWNGSAPDTIVTDYVHAEVDLGNPTRSGTNWYWLDVSPNEGNLGTGEVNVQHAHARGSAEIKIGLFTLQSGSFNYRFSINGNVYSDSLMTLPVRSQFPPNYLTGTTLLSGDSSRILLELTRVAGSPPRFVAYLNTIDMLFERVTDLNTPFHAFFMSPREYTIQCRGAAGTLFILDVTDARNPRRFSGYTQEGSTVRFTAQCDSFQLLYAAQYAAAQAAILTNADPGRLRTPGAGCEYLIITHPKFYHAVQPIADYRRHQYTVKIVTIDDIYNDFAYGNYDPLAIKHFLYYTLNNWITYPAFVFIVGDATYDFRNNLGKSDPPDYVPMYESGTQLAGNPGMPPNFIYEGEYVNFTGGESMVLGRLTARTQQEVRDYYDKLIQYEDHGTQGMWNKRIILAGDDEWSAAYKWEWGFAPHCPFCEQTISHVPDSLYDFVKVYMVSYPPFTYPCQKLNAQKAFISELSKGAFAGLYYGHGNTHQLADEGLLFDWNIPSIRNGRRNFFYYFGSCTVGRFNDSDYECIAEQLVRVREGAIGTMAETGPSSAGSNKMIGDSLFALITKTDLTMGECFNSTPHGEYLLLGDPAVRLQRPDPDAFTPLLVAPDSVRPLGHVLIAPPSSRYYLRGFVRDSTTMEKFDETTLDRISGYVSRRIQTSDVPSYVTFTYPIDGKEIYHGFWDDTATFIAPKIVTTHMPVMKFSTYFDGLSGMRDSLAVYGTASPTTDELGPDIVFYDRGRRLQDNDWVTREFTLTGKVSDESGINMLNSVNDVRGFFVYVNRDIESKIDLRNSFIYDRNSYTSGEFNVELNLPEAVDTIHFNVTDNHFNQTTVILVLNVELYGDVDIENFLIYPNPVTAAGNVWFTFTLSNAGTVSLKVFTIAGRLIKTIDNVTGSAGYNQVAWNGRDAYGDAISNGVYLVKVFAQGTSGSDEIVEKFIIAR